MSWKEWAKSETWIQEQIKWKSTVKSLSSPRSPSAGSERSVRESLLIPLNVDLGGGRDSENTEQWHFQKELVLFLVMRKNLLPTLKKVAINITQKISVAGNFIRNFREHSFLTACGIHFKSFFILKSSVVLFSVPRGKASCLWNWALSSAFPIRSAKRSTGELGLLCRLKMI